MCPPELFPTPAPEGKFDTLHEVRLGTCTFETKMSTPRDYLPAIVTSFKIGDCE